MLNFKTTILYATWACVSVATENTLELRGNVVYGQPFNLVCFSNKNTSYYSGIFFRNFNASHSGTKVASVLYLNTCTVNNSSFTNYTYGCSNDGKNITLTVPAENEAEHNTFWRCANQAFPNQENNNVIQVFINDPVGSVKIRNSTVVNVIEGISETFVCESSPCRPSADIYWMKNRINITDAQANSSIFQSGTKNITSSYLRYTADRGDNGSLLACGAYNGYGTGEYSANVTFVVQYPPIVNNFTSPLKVIQGQSLEVLCNADGNPSPKLTWNPVGEDKVNKSRLYYSAISRDKAVIHTCTAKNNMVSTTGSPQTGSDSKDFLIDVLYSPIVNNFTSPVKVIQGQPLDMVCSAEGNPYPQLIWNPMGEDKVNNSRLYYLNISRDKAVNHTCTAKNNMVPTNGISQPGSDSKKLQIDVLYSPMVRNFTSPIKVIQGQPLELVCSADGNPPPQLTWNPAGEDKVNKSRLYYSAISRDMAVIHTCKATNIMVPTTGSPQSGLDLKDLLIDVLYSPIVNNFTSPLKVIQGHPLEVLCSADGNPSPLLTWNPAGEDKVNKSRLYYSAISRDKAVIHTCTATNNMVPTTVNLLPGSDSKTLLIDVLYSPTVNNNFTSPLKVIQGHPLEVLCSADGNPSPQLTWNPVGEDKVNKSRLYYSAISRDKAVIHTCTATNIMVPTNGSSQPGSDLKEILIDVLYNASLSEFTSKDKISLVNENGSLQLQCQVDSNPNSIISLYLENDLKMFVEDALNLSYTKTATCLDAGKYTCSATNKIMNGDAVSKSIQINVTCYPRLDFRKNISTEYYGALGENVTLEVYVIAYPEPRNIAWYHREKDADMWQMFSYQSPSSNGFYSSITVHLATERDYGYYKVNMSNDFGIYNNAYHIIPGSIPGVPTNFTVTVNGPDSVTLEWTPGFEGGHPQEFIIQYRIFPDGAWVKFDKVKDSGSSKQTITITGLQQKTTYEFHLYAENIKGRSDNTSVIVATTEMKDTAFPVAAMAGSISGVLVAGVCVTFVIIFFRRRGQRIKRMDYDLDRELKEKERPESGAAKGRHGKTSRGDVYENADIVGMNPSKENVYANSKNKKTEASGDNTYENPEAATSHGPIATKDGLLYADLKLDPPTAKNGKPVIWGIENRTEYAEIEYGKKGEPLPDSHEEK